MTKERAAEILRRVWGGQSILSAAEWHECRQAGADHATNYDGKPMTLLAWLQLKAGDVWDCASHGGAFSVENTEHFKHLEMGNAKQELP